MLWVSCHALLEELGSLGDSYARYKDRHFVKSAQTGVTDTESVSYQLPALLGTDKHHVVIFT